MSITWQKKAHIQGDYSKVFLHFESRPLPMRQIAPRGGRAQTLAGPLRARLGYPRMPTTLRYIGRDAMKNTQPPGLGILNSARPGGRRPTGVMWGFARYSHWRCVSSSRADSHHLSVRASSPRGATRSLGSPNLLLAAPVSLAPSLF